MEGGAANHGASRPVLDPQDIADELVTVRDYLRLAVSRFTAAGLAFGQGTTSALDEAAFIILEALGLPIDDINPWLDARLMPAERLRIARLIVERIETRKPAAYLLGKAYVQGVPFRVDERVIVPRSYIGEVLAAGHFDGEGLALIDDAAGVERVLDLCTGSGCLAILAAMTFANARVDAVDVSGDALEVARANVADHGLEERVMLHQGDLYEPLGPARYNLILTNPPYVDAKGMADLPPEFRHEPTLALAAGADGLDIVRRIIAGAGGHLKAGGGLLCEVGRAGAVLEATFPDLVFLWLDTEESQREVFWLPAEALV
jgi:ribosomal protein L3 glutamine methyltransferase